MLVKMRVRQLSWLGRLVALLFVLACVGGFTPASVAADDLDVSGVYHTVSTGDASAEFDLKLTQVGATIAGTYGSGSLGGKLVGKRVDAMWREGSADGWLTFTFAADGKSFEGEWGYPGAKPAGKWIGKKL